MHKDYTRPSVSKRLKYKRKQFGLNQAQLADLSGVSQRQISAYEREKSEPRPDTLEKLASALNTSAEWLEFGDDDSDIEIATEDSMKESLTATHVPILQWDADSLGRAGSSFFQSVIPIPDAASDESFALVVKGDSMEPEYPAGSIIVVDPNITVQSGHDVVASIYGEITFKRYSEEPSGKIFLVPLNKQFPAMSVKREDIQIFGVVVLQLIYRNNPL
ncbi:LexA family protein [Terasakiella pusilla]|uniref:LexA family protein n=1 Tax=Terasakiella pusilla TaxID=64973 RepID=UPI003AA9C899